MAFQPFLISNTQVGIERDMEPWLLPQDAFVDLEDCYNWRGRIRRRLGYRQVGFLQLQIGVTDGAGNFTFTLPNPPIGEGLIRLDIGGQTFQDFFSVSNTTTLLTNGAGVATLTKSTGVISVTGAPATLPVLLTEHQPVMGLPTLESADQTVDQEIMLAFDQTYAYRYTASGFQGFSNYKGTLTTLANVTWSGSDIDFFWTTNYAKAFWATNNNPGYQTDPVATTDGFGDGIRWHDQVLIGLPGWVNFLPPINNSANPNDKYLMGCLIILPYKGCLVCFSTWEGKGDPRVASNVTQFRQRARWSGPPLGTPYYNSTLPNGWQGGFNADAWKSDLPGNGGFIDAPTQEAIVSAEFVKDTLIVYFERSTWNFRWTGNVQLPFIWEKINTELGSVSTFSAVPFDKVCVAVGDVGIHACDTVNVERIDQKVPDEVFSIQIANNGTVRTYGIRDYFNQLVYWTIPYVGENFQIGFQQGAEVVFPNKVLVYNYIDSSFAFFNDSFTCFGYFQPVNSPGPLWGDNPPTIPGSTTTAWGDTSMKWGQPDEQQESFEIAAGNQQGCVVVVQQQNLNDPAFFINGISVSGTTVTINSPNHNLQSNMFVKITRADNVSNLVGRIYKITVPGGLSPDPDNFTLQQDNVTITGMFGPQGYYSVVNNVNIQTKRFNPFIGEDSQVRLGRVDFFLEKTDDGQLTVNLFDDEDNSVVINEQPYDAPFTLITSIQNSASYPQVGVTDASIFSVKDLVTFSGVQGMFQINGLTSIVVSVDTTNNIITVNLNTSSFGVFTPSSSAFVSDLSTASGNIINTFPETTYSVSDDTSLANAKLWKRMQFYDTAQLFQLQITMNDKQMLAEPISQSNIVLHAMCLYFAKGGKLINV